MRGWSAKARSIGWAALALLVTILTLFLLTRRDKSDPGTPTIVDVMQAKSNKANEESLKIRVEARVEAEQDRKELNRAMAINDGAERRKRLAELLKRGR